MHSVEKISTGLPSRWPVALAFAFSAIVLVAIAALAWRGPSDTAILTGVLVLLLLVLLAALYRRTLAAGLPRQLLKAGALQDAIFNSANFSSIATDAQGVIQIFNVGAERMLGYAAHEVVDKLTPASISDAQEIVARAQALSAELDTPITPGVEALRHAGIHTERRVNIEDIDSEEIETTGCDGLGKYDAILVPGGFGKRGVEGKIKAAQFARENKIPYLGICLGMQVALIEYARNKAGMPNANSTEFDLDTDQPVVALINEWQNHDGKVELRDENSDLGGTMRLGAQTCAVNPGTLAAEIYGSVVTERHRHRYEANNHYLARVEAAGMIVSARTPSEDLCEIMELPRTGENSHPWYMGVQYHPEFKSTPRTGHPLFTSFIKAALAHKEANAAAE